MPCEGALLTTLIAYEMKETIRKSLPRNLSIGVLILIFAMVYFLAAQLFKKGHTDLIGVSNIHLAYFLVSMAVLVMILILWEELLFPVRIKREADGFIFRNHRNKLKFQAAMYMIIPAIVVFLYLNYEVSMFRFFGWAAVVLILPAIGKLKSGINNYNDFLTLTPSKIEFKDNDHEGSYKVEDIQKLQLTKDDTDGLDELILGLKSGEEVRVQVHQMELDDFFESIEEYVSGTYQTLT